MVDLSSLRVGRRGLVLAVLAAVLIARTARAGEPSGKRIPLSLTISGGVSLGAYEAGLLHYTLAWIQANDKQLDLRLATGASAGSVNAVLAVLTHCGEGTPRFSESLFWKTWVPLGFGGLFAESDVTMRSAFSRRWMEKTGEEVGERWRAGISRACDVVLGVSATRVIPRTVELAAGALQVPRVEEHFAVRIQGRGPGMPPRITNYVDSDGAGNALLLPEGADGEVPFSSLRDLLFASAAFPLAFAPVELAHCAPVRGRALPRCPKASAQKAYFIDGGVFDNTPLRLAVWLARSGLREQPGGWARWLDSSRASRPKLPTETRFVFVSPDVTAYPAPEETFHLDRETSLLPLIGQEARSFLVTARAKNLSLLLDETPEIADQVIVATRHYPAASSPMSAFFGFFEREFRRYDFYLGMYDAHRGVTQNVLPTLDAASRAKVVFPEEAKGAEPEAWQPLRCLTAAFDNPSRAREACAGESLRDFRILAQTSLERLYQECIAAQGDSPATKHGHCQRAREGGAPPRLPEVETEGGSSWRKREGESEPAWVARLLSTHRFQFRDLGLTRSDSGEALRKMRLELGRVVKSVAAAQPSGESLVMERLGQIAANELVYVPPRNVMWLAFSRDVEIGWSYGDPNLPGFAGALHLHFALQSYGLYDLLSTERRPWGLAPLAGIGGVLPFASNSAFQHGFFLRAGWLFGSEDRFGTRACANPGDNTLGSCSRFTAQLGAYVAAFEVLRLQLVLESFPGFGTGQRAMWNLSPALGLQLVF